METIKAMESIKQFFQIQKFTKMKQKTMETMQQFFLNLKTTKMKKGLISLGFAALALGANAQVKIKDGTTAGSVASVRVARTTEDGSRIADYFFAIKKYPYFRLSFIKQKIFCLWHNKSAEYVLLIKNSILV